MELQTTDHIFIMDCRRRWAVSRNGGPEMLSVVGEALGPMCILRRGQWGPVTNLSLKMSANFWLASLKYGDVVIQLHILVSSALNTGDFMCVCMYVCMYIYIYMS